MWIQDLDLRAHLSNINRYLLVLLVVFLLSIFQYEKKMSFDFLIFYVGKRCFNAWPWQKTSSFYKTQIEKVYEQKRDIT